VSCDSYRRDIALQLFDAHRFFSLVIFIVYIILQQESSPWRCVLWP